MKRRTLRKDGTSAPAIEEFSVPGYVIELFRAAIAADTLAPQYADMAADRFAEAWRAFEQIHPQVPGYYYTYNEADRIVRRFPRPDPELKDKA